HTAYAAVPLDWTKALDVSNGGAFDDGVPVTTPTPTGPVTETIAYTGPKFRAFGQVSVDLIDGFLTGDLGFSLELATADVKVDASTTLHDAKLAELSFTVSNLSIGAGGVGFQVASGGLAIVTVKPADPADKRTWLAVQADLQGGSFSGIDGLDLTVH